MKITDALATLKPGRKITGMAAALLPFDQNGQIAEEAFAANLRTTQAAGLTNAVNMDTGYVNLLNREEKQRVLALTRATLGPDAPFVAGAYIERDEGDNPVALWRREIEAIAAHGGTPILFQTARLHGKTAREKATAYREAIRDVPQALAFELGTMFAPNGEIFDAETVTQIMDIPQIVGMKHSSLDKAVELGRLALKDRLRPEFVIYTGNDLGIDMVCHGSDYLLGLAAFSPESFAARDRAWESDDYDAYFPLADALQHLGNLAFRPPVPAYKHSAAVFLHLLGKIPTDRTHPGSPQRPAWEVELMRDCARRLGLLP